LERVYDFDRVRVELEELANDDIRLEADRVGVRTNECPAKDAGRPMRDIIPFQGLEQRNLDFRLLGDRRERDLLLLAPFAQACAKTVRHGATPGATTDAAFIMNVGNSKLRKFARHTAPEDRSPRSLGRGRPPAMRGATKPAKPRETTCGMQFKPRNALPAAKIRGGDDTSARGVINRS